MCKTTRLTDRNVTMNGMEEKARAVKDSDASEWRCPGGKHAASSHLSEGSIEGRRSGQLNWPWSHRRWKMVDGLR